MNVVFSGGWANNSQYRGQYPPPGNAGSGSQPWTQGPPRPGGPPTSQPNSGQWCQPSYQSPQQVVILEMQFRSAFAVDVTGDSNCLWWLQAQQQWGPNMSGAGATSPLRPMGPRPPYRQDGKPYSMSSALPGVKVGSVSAMLAGDPVDFVSWYWLRRCFCCRVSLLPVKLPLRCLSPQFLRSAKCRFPLTASRRLCRFYINVNDSLAPMFTPSKLGA